MGLPFEVPDQSSHAGNGGLPCSQRFHRDRPRPPGFFACEWENHGLAAAWLRVEGELDVATAAELRKALSGRRVAVPLAVLDLRGLVFIDISGVRVIAGASVVAREAGGRVIVVSPSRGVDEVFALTGTADAVERFHLGPTEPVTSVLLRGRRSY